MADFLEAELPRLRDEWESGSFSSLVEAFCWCAWNGYTFPDWLSVAVLDELGYSMANRPRGGTKQGNAAAHERAESIHRVRYLLVDNLLMFQEMERKTPISQIQAARDAADFLREHNHAARGSAEAILKSYKRLKSG